MNNLYKVEVVGKDEHGKNIYGCVYKDKAVRHIGMPESWGTKHHATKYMVEQKLFVPMSEWKICAK